MSKLMSANRIIFGAILALSAAHPAYSKPSKAEDRMLAQINRTPAEVETYIMVKGDSLDPSVEVSTYRATMGVRQGMFMTSEVETSFLRGYIDRKTGVASAQIYHIATYSGNGWNLFRRATYEAPGGIKEVEVTAAGNDVQCQRYGCTYVEEVVFPVDFAVLEAAAARYSPETAVTGIRYRIFGQSGVTIDEAIPSNEIAAFVNVVKRRQAKILKAGTPAP